MHDEEICKGMFVTVVVLKYWDLGTRVLIICVQLTPHISVQVQLAIAGIIAADSSAYKDQVASWDGEKRVVSK